MSGEGSSRQNDDDLSDTFRSQMTLQEPQGENMHREAERVKTFANWSVAGVSKHELATLGLYFLSAPDIVKCAFCPAQLSNWTSNDDIFIKHLLKNKDCPLLTLQANTNVPLDPQALDRVLLSASYGFDTIIEETIAAPLPIHPQYEQDDARYQTFNSWTSNKQTPDDLCDGGFFSNGNNDEVICFSCGGCVKDWKEDDNIWEIHAVRFSDCDYVKFIKGEAFIEEVKEKYGSRGNTTRHEDPTTLPSTAGTASNEYQTNAPPSPNAPVEETSSRDNVEDRTCKVCLDKEYSTCFVPCGHVVTCSDCAKEVTTCPLCRQPFTAVTPIHLS